MNSELFKKVEDIILTVLLLIGIVLITIHWK